MRAMQEKPLWETDPLSPPSPSFQLESSQRGEEAAKRGHVGGTEGTRMRGKEK